MFTLIFPSMIHYENQQLCCVTGILGANLSDAVFKYISYNVMENVNTTAHKHTHSSNKKGGGEYIHSVLGGMCQTSGECPLS